MQKHLNLIGFFEKLTQIDNESNNVIFFHMIDSNIFSIIESI